MLTIFELENDFTKPIEEFIGEIDTFKDFVKSNPTGNVYFSVEVTAEKRFPVDLCYVRPVISVGILSSTEISTVLVIRLLSLLIK